MLKHVRRLGIVSAILFVTVHPLQAAGDRWEPFRFLMGTWVGEGSGQPGKGTGGFTLAPDLQGKILVRKNRNEIPASGGRPAATHEDLMIIYPGEKGKPPNAIYFDNEGHVIKYTVSSSEAGLVFLSDPSPSAPRFRLTYTKTGADTVGIKFEFAPPGKPDTFRTYIAATARKKGP